MFQIYHSARWKGFVRLSQSFYDNSETLNPVGALRVGMSSNSLTLSFNKYTFSSSQAYAALLSFPPTLTSRRREQEMG